MPLWLMDIAMLIRDRTRELGREPGSDEMETMPRYAVERIGRMSAHEYLDVRRLAHRICLAMLRAFGAFDLIVTPATGTLPPPVGVLDANAPDFDLARWGAAGYAFAPYNRFDGSRRVHPQSWSSSEATLSRFRALARLGGNRRIPATENSELLAPKRPVTGDMPVTH